MNETNVIDFVEAARRACARPGGHRHARHYEVVWLFNKNYINRANARKQKEVKHG